MTHLTSQLQLLLHLSICFLGWNCASGRSVSRAQTPIVFIPGKAGNRLEAKVNKDRSFNHCPLQKDWHRCWMDVWQLFPDRIDCWSETMQLYFNETSERSYNAPGVTVRVPGWGTSEVVEYLDPSWIAWLFGNVGKYMKPFVSELTKWGYVKGVNFRAAPFDFRLAPCSHSDYFRDLASLIEDTYEKNDKLPVLLVAHSMGGKMGRYFLAKQAGDWKNKYIRAFVTVNTPWKGSVRITHSLVSGFDWGSNTVDPLVMRGLLRTHESAVYLLPEEGGWDTNETIVVTPQRNYTVEDYDQLFEDTLWTKGSSLVRYVRKDDSFEHPGVATFCFHGGEKPTVKQLVYENEASFPDEQPQLVWGDGDGTVNVRSLQYCNRWLNDPLYGNITYIRHVKHTDHVSLFEDTTFLNWLYGFVFSTSTIHT